MAGQEFTELVWAQVGITWPGVVGVVLATCVLYAVYATITAVLGPRLRSSPSVLSVTVVAMLGALTARAMLGNTPTMGGALVAILVLLVLETALGRVEASLRLLHHGRGTRRGRAVVVVLDGRPVDPLLHERRLTEGQLMARLRMTGVRRLDEVALAVLERRGTLTVVRRGERIDPRLFRGVAGLDEDVLDRLSSPPADQG